MSLERSDHRIFGKPSVGFLARSQGQKEVLGVKWGWVPESEERELDPRNCERE